MKKPIFRAMAALLLLFMLQVALAYYARVSVCWWPPRVVTDQERIDKALIVFRRLSQYSPYPRDIDLATCCSVDADRSSGDFGVTLQTVATGKWVELVTVRYGPSGARVATFRSNICGHVVLDY